MHTLSLKEALLRPTKRNNKHSSHLPVDARLSAALIVAQLLSGSGSLNQLLAAAIPDTLSHQDRAFCKALCFGTFRHIFSLRSILASLLKKPFKPSDTDLQAILLIALYQLLHLHNIPPHAAVSSAVENARQLNKEWACGLINAVLRNLLRQKDALIDDAQKSPENRYETPRWLLKTVQKEWPEKWEDILTAALERPPLIIRVNSSKTERASYLTALQEQGIEAEPLPHLPDAVHLLNPESVTEIPGFAQGVVSVQDGGAQLAVELLQLSAGMRVLDACAAPGGKSCHILERFPNIELLAIDSEAERLKKLSSNFSRIGLSATQICADATQPQLWWDNRHFDRIMLDAPCSGTGVLRRNPDIRWLRKPEQIKLLVDTQIRLLNALWQLLKPGGVLLYITCSILPQENENLIKDWIKSTNDAQPCKISLDWLTNGEIGSWLLPGNISRTDGFYFARLCKSLQQPST